MRFPFQFDRNGEGFRCELDYSDATTGTRLRSDPDAGEKFSDAPRLSAARPATISPSAPATRSPLRSVGSFSILTGARPMWSLPLQVHPATSSLRSRKAFGSSE